MGRDLFEFWTQLETSLLSYNKILEQRAKCEESILNLHNENNDLKQLLKESLDSEINNKLIFPPKYTVASHH